ncbi:MAG: hypothetical protein AAF802_11700 [Planctomycetota bacterium]
MNDTDRTQTTTSRFYWLVGDELKDEILKAKHPGAALLDHFKIKRSRWENNNRILAEYELPEDLYANAKDDPKIRLKR